MRLLPILAQFLNSHNYDNGDQINTLLLGFYQLEWAIFLLIGVQLFIGFSGRFKQ